MPMTAIADRSKELIIPSNASGKPALFKKFENIVAPNNNANNLAARTDASLKTLKYSTSAQDYKQNRHAGFLSIRPLAASPRLTMYARSNFTFKSPAGIKIHTHRTSLNAPLGAIRPMFSLLWRAPCTCHLSPSWSLSRTSPTFALKPQWESKFHILRHLFAL